MSLPLAIKQRLLDLNLTEAMPAWKIMTNARFLPATPGSPKLYGDSVEQALKKLMKSFFEYGRQHWRWSQSSGAAASDGGLVKGLVHSAACATFNQNFKWLAEKCLGIDNITSDSVQGNFLTMPGQDCIDAQWIGNVRTTRRPFLDLKCFKFNQHYWVKHGGINYDVCYNHTFVDSREIIWTKLVHADQVLVKKSGLRADQVYKLEKPLPEGDHLVMIQQNGPQGWPNWMIVDKSQVGRKLLM